MRWYKILAQILLMLSVVDFAPAAPVLVREHEVRVSVVDAVKDGTATSRWRWDTYKWPENPADRTNAPPIARSSDSGHWREQEPRQYKPRLRRDSKGSAEPSNLAPPIDLYANNPPNLSLPPGPGSTSPSLSSRAPTDESDPLNPSSSDDDSYASTPASSSGSSLGPSHDSLSSFPQPNSPKSKHLSEVASTPTYDSPPLDNSLLWQIMSSSDEPYASSSWVPTDKDSGSTSSSSPQHDDSPPARLPGSPQDHVPSLPKIKSLSELMATTSRVTSPQVSSSSDESYSSDTDSGSTSSESWHPQHHVPSLPGSKYESLPGAVSTATRVASPPDGSLQILSSSDETYSPGTDSGSTSSESWSSQHHDSSPASSPGWSQHHVPSLPGSRYKSLPGAMSTATRVTSPPEGSLQILSSSDETYSPGTDSGSTSSESWSSQYDDSPPASSPGLSQNHVPSLPGSKYKSLPGIKSTTARVTSPPDGFLQISSSSDETYLPSTSTDSTNSESWSSQHYDSPPASSPGGSQDHIPSLPGSKYKSLPGVMSTTTRVTSPPDDSRRISSSSDETHSPGTDSGSTSSESSSQQDVSAPASSPGSSQDFVAAPPNSGDHVTPGRLSSSSDLPTAEYYLGSSDQLSTAESRPPIPGPTDNPPPPASSSNPGPSTEQNPSPSPKRPRPDEPGSFVSKIFKEGKFRPRFSGSSPLNVATRALPGYLGL